MERSKSAAKERTIAELDGVLTVALTVLIFGSVIYPNVFLQKPSNKIYGNEFEVDWGMGETVNPSGVHTTFMEEKKQLNKSDIAILTIAAILGLTSVLAGAVLFMSTNPRNTREKKLQMMRYWMHCNLLTAPLTVLEFVFVFMFLDNSAEVLAYILAYIGFRVVAAFVIQDSVRALSPQLIPTLDPVVAEVNHRYQRNFEPPRPNPPEPYLVLPLRPYRGSGISAPRCQCIAPQQEV